MIGCNVYDGEPRGDGVCSGDGMEPAARVVYGGSWRRLVVVVMV